MLHHNSEMVSGPHPCIPWPPRCWEKCPAAGFSSTTQTASANTKCTTYYRATMLTENNMGTM